MYVVEGATDGLITADLSPDESLLATAAYDKTVRITRMGAAAPSGGASGAAAMYGGTTLAVLDHPAPAVAGGLAFSPDGRRLAVALEDNTVVSHTPHGGLRACVPSWACGVGLCGGGAEVIGVNRQAQPLSLCEPRYGWGEWGRACVAAAKRGTASSTACAPGCCVWCCVRCGSCPAGCVAAFCWPVGACRWRPPNLPAPFTRF